MMNRTVLVALVVIAFAATVKFTVVDAYFPTAPGNMLIWIPITIVACLAIIGLTVIYGLITGRHRPPER